MIYPRLLSEEVCECVCECLRVFGRVSYLPSKGAIGVASKGGGLGALGACAQRKRPKTFQSRASPEPRAGGHDGHTNNNYATARRRRKAERSKWRLERDEGDHKAKPAKRR